LAPPPLQSMMTASPTPINKSETLPTTQVYAESTPAMIKESYRRALAE